MAQPELPPRPVTYSMGMSVDGFVVGPDGGFDWAVPDAELFASHLDELRGTGVQLMGRHLYETMLYWETADQEPGLDEAEREWTRLWNALPKVVFSTTLASVQGNARLAEAGLAEEVARLRAEPGEGSIAIGGARLAWQAAALDLIDVYRPTIHPVLLGGGVPYFPQEGRPVALRLVASRTFGSGVLDQRYRVER
jgi:dihydrofolate reductase